MPKITTTIDMTGPFFAHDPTKTFRQNVRVMMAAVAVEAESDVRAQMQVGESQRRPIAVGGGRVSSEVEGYTSGIRSGKPWALTARVHIRNSGLSRERGISLHAAAASIESRVHPFRKTASRMRRAKAINQAELLKGLQ